MDAGYSTKDLPAPVLERGPWTATASGGMWSILNPHPSDVRLFDIASGLSRACRYNGQIREDVDFFSVAEHSSIITLWMIEQGLVRTREDALKVHLHDGSESILGDMVSPVKRLLPEFVALEDRVQDTIEVAFGLEHATIPKALIKEIDTRIRMDEREAVIEEPALSHQKKIVWEKDPDLQPLGVDILCLPPRQARHMFMETFLRCCALPLAQPSLERQHEPFIEEARRDLERSHVFRTCSPDQF